jgi:hypothetical protein
MNAQFFERAVLAVLTGLCANPELAESTPREWARDAYSTAVELMDVIDSERAQDKTA